MRLTRGLIPPELLIQGYMRGYFPMADPDTGEIEWYTASPRAVLPLDPFHVPRRLARSLKKATYTYSRDRDFEAVIQACSDRESSWINDVMIRSYTHLHHLGFAHSVEVWRESELVGGLYGVHLGGAFFGESMFHRESGASKAALVHLAERLNAQGFRLLEIQMVTSLTEQFGPRLVPRREYLRLLQDALSVQCAW
jgi:leucyl/phenylalanyl-tRNA---protein transferase